MQTFDGGGSWRATELQNNTPFTITAQDCVHVGNRDVDHHLDLRYCE